MALKALVQYSEGIVEGEDCPRQQDFATWAQSIAAADAAEVTVRVTNDYESAQLNQRYRDKLGASNVLSFSYDPSHDAQQSESGSYLGDIVMAAELIQQQAEEQSKSLLQHWAHLFIHGVLHLQGYQHNDDDSAQVMEQQEILILKNLGFPDPYQPVSPSK